MPQNTDPIPVNVFIPQLATVLVELRLMRAALARVLTTQGVEMSKLTDLQEIDTELADAVTALSGAVSDVAADVARLDADFAALETAAANGDVLGLDAEIAKIRGTIDQVKASAQAAVDAKSSIDTTDPAPAAPVEPAPATDGTADQAPAAGEPTA